MADRTKKKHLLLSARKPSDTLLRNCPNKEKRKREGEMTFRSLSRESVIVVMDANRNRGSDVDALDWALNNVVRPKDTVIVIGILCEFGKAKHPSSSSSSSCFPFYTGIGISAIWERLEFSGQGEMTPQVLEVEIAKKREQYQCTLQPFYRQCNKNEVKLEVKLAAGFDPRKITIEEAHNCNTRWIVLDSHLKKHKSFIYEHAGCNVAAMKEKDVATISLARAAEFERITRKSVDMEEDVNPAVQPDNKTVNEVSNTILQGEKLGTSPLSWRTGFPRVCTEVEIESMTNGFASENVIQVDENLQVYQGIHLQAPVLVKRFFKNDERFWLELKTLSRVRHRNISNLVGYCCSDTSMFLIRDYSYIESLEVHLQRDELAKNLDWKARLNIAQDIGSCLRYLQEECLDGPIMLLSVSSSHVLFSHGCSMMLTEFTKSANHWSGYSPADRKHFMTRSPDWESKEGDEHHSLHVHAYGLFLMELLTGRSIHSYEDVQSMIEWAIPVLESGYLSQIVDPRLVDSSSDAKEVRDLASAVLMCLKNDHGHLSSVSEVLAAVRGDRFGSLHF